jgi:hypothetical protein
MRYMAVLMNQNTESNQVMYHIATALAPPHSQNGMSTYSRGRISSLMNRPRSRARASTTLATADVEIE